MQTKLLVIAVVGFKVIDKLLISHISSDNTGDKMEHSISYSQTSRLPMSYLVEGFHMLFSFRFLALMKLVKFN